MGHNQTNQKGKKENEKEKENKSGNPMRNKEEQQKDILRTGLRPPFRFCVWVTSCVKASISASGVETDELTEPSRSSGLVTTGSMAEKSLFLCFLVEREASTIETIGFFFFFFFFESFLFLFLFPGLDYYLFWWLEEIIHTKPDLVK